MARMKKATFRDAQTVARARAARRKAKRQAPTTDDTTNTAADAYREHGVAIETLMEALAEATERHADAHHADPKNWGYVGDLDYVRGLITNAITFLDGEK